MSWISPHNLRTKASPASKQFSPVKQEPARFTPPQPSPVRTGEWAPTRSGNYFPSMIPDDTIPAIAPPSLLPKKVASMPQPAPLPQPSSYIEQTQVVQPQHIIRRSSPQAVRAPVQTQIMRSPVIQRHIVQPQRTEMFSPNRIPARQVVMQSPVRVAHQMMPQAMPMRADPYAMGEDFQFQVEEQFGEEQVTETDFDGPSFSYGEPPEQFAMQEQYAMQPTNYAYMQPYDPGMQAVPGYDERVMEPQPNGGYQGYDHGLVPDGDPFQNAPPPPPPRNEEPPPPPPRDDVARPDPRSDVAPPPARNDPVHEPRPPPSPPQRGPDPFASVPAGGDPFASVPVNNAPPPPPPEVEEAKIVKKANPMAPSAVRAAPPPPPPVPEVQVEPKPEPATREVPVPAPAAVRAAAPPPPEPRAPLNEQVVLRGGTPAVPAGGQGEPYTDELHEFEEDLISRIEATLAEANRTLEEHSNRYPIRGAELGHM